jgi:hypothetical protein
MGSAILSPHAEAATNLSAAFSVDLQRDAQHGITVARPGSRHLLAGRGSLPRSSNGRVALGTAAACGTCR